MKMRETSLADRLRQVAEAVGSVAAFARACEISSSTLNGYVSGRFEPRVSELRKIAETAGVTVGWLVNGEDLPPTLRSPPAEPPIEAGLWREMTALAIEICRDAAILDRVPARKFASLVEIMCAMAKESGWPHDGAVGAEARLQKYRKLIELI
jgi:transcriptional regulator with XRE-family HTH domain